jgi:hypothetical protein
VAPGVMERSAIPRGGAPWSAEAGSPARLEAARPAHARNPNSEAGRRTSNIVREVSQRGRLLPRSRGPGSRPVRSNSGVGSCRGSWRGRPTSASPRGEAGDVGGRIPLTDQPPHLGGHGRGDRHGHQRHPTDAWRCRRTMWASRPSHRIEMPAFPQSGRGCEGGPLYRVSRPFLEGGRRSLARRASAP